MSLQEMREFVRQYRAELGFVVHAHHEPGMQANRAIGIRPCTQGRFANEHEVHLDPQVIDRATEHARRKILDIGLHVPVVEDRSFIA